MISALFAFLFSKRRRLWETAVYLFIHTFTTMLYIHIHIVIPSDIIITLMCDVLSYLSPACVRLLRDQFVTPCMVEGWMGERYVDLWEECSLSLFILVQCLFVRFDLLLCVPRGNERGWKA